MILINVIISLMAYFSYKIMNYIRFFISYELNCHYLYILEAIRTLKSNKFDKFKKLVPHGAFSGGFIRPTKIPNEKFDIIQT